MPWGIAAAAIGSALIGAHSSRKAADAAKAGADKSAEVQRYMFDTQRADTAPWREAGQVALGALGDMMGLNFSTPAPTTSTPTEVPPYKDTGDITLPAAATDSRVPSYKRNQLVDNAIRASGYGAPFMSDMPVARRYGGPVNRGQPALVGEEGPEKVFSRAGQPMGVVGNSGPEIIKPGQDIHVRPNPKTTAPDGMPPGWQVPYNSNKHPDGINSPNFDVSNKYSTRFGGKPSPITSIDLGTDWVSGGPDDPTGGRGPSTVSAPASQTTSDPDDSPYDWTTDPGYEFRFDEGVRATLANAAASGFYGSGRVGRELTRYGQGVASQEYGNIWNRLAAISGVGQTAVNSIPYAAYGQGIGGAYQAGGDARASGYMGVGNAINQGIGNAVYWNANRPTTNHSYSG